MYAVGLRGWQICAGAVSVFLIGYFFGKDEQGYYYTFASLMALQALFETGLGVVVINVASHEWSRLSLDIAGRITGNPEARSRLISLGRLLARWYLAAAALFAVVVGWGGAAFLASGNGNVAWQSPWWALVLVSATHLWILPFTSLLEGCGQVAVVHRNRLVQAMTANVAVWSCILAGGGLWAAVGASAARLVWDAWLVGVRYRRFYRPFLSRPPIAISWRSEIWPMQWRLAVQACVGYLASSLATPIMFHYHGADVAGRLGMTWVLITALHSAAFAWIQTRVPKFGVLIARKQFGELDELYRRLLRMALGVAVAGAVGLWGIVFALNQCGHWLADRLLDPVTTAVFLVGTCLYLNSFGQECYLRAYKRDPFLLVNVVTDALIGGLTWWWGSQYGPIGAAVAYCGVIVCAILPWQTAVFRRCRREWREDAQANPSDRAR